MSLLVKELKEALSRVEAKQGESNPDIYEFARAVVEVMISEYGEHNADDFMRFVRERILYGYKD
jgi:hypothetical protein